MIEIEGLTAREFVEWVARERGWDLSFSDGLVERAASETTLGGSVEGLTLLDSLEAVLPTCLMTHRVEEGRLIISSLREGTS